MIRVAKLIPVFPYTSQRRAEDFTNGPKSYDIWLKTFNELIDAEIHIDAGCPMDIFLYYRSIPGDRTGEAEIYKFDGQATPNGVITVTEMDNDNIKGFSIIREFILSGIPNMYDYILYQEDDVVLVPGCDGYVFDSVSRIENKEYKVIGYSVAVTQPFVHMGGLFALIPLKPLIANIEAFPLNAQGDELDINKWVNDSLGIQFIDVGYLPQYKNFPVNYETVTCFKQNYVTPFWRTEGRFLFRVGAI